MRELRFGDMVRIYTGCCNYKREYLIVLWGKQKYRTSIRSYNPIAAIDMDGEPISTTIGVSPTNYIKPITPRDYLELSQALLHKKIIFNKKIRKICQKKF